MAVVSRLVAGRVVRVYAARLHVYAVTIVKSPTDAGCSQNIASSWASSLHEQAASEVVAVAAQDLQLLHLKNTIIISERNCCLLRYRF